ncbi:hypothetical protein D3C79_719540 [compost metagenome]
MEQLVEPLLTGGGELAVVVLIHVPGPAFVGRARRTAAAVLLEAPQQGLRRKCLQDAVERRADGLLIRHVMNAHVVQALGHRRRCTQVDRALLLGKQHRQGFVIVEAQAQRVVLDGTQVLVRQRGLFVLQLQQPLHHGPHRLAHLFEHVVGLLGILQLQGLTQAAHQWG